MSSLSDLRKELREIRKTVVRPISKMKKHEVVMELEGRKKPMKVVEEVESESDSEPVVVKKASAPKKVAPAVKVVEKKAPAVKVVEKKAPAPAPKKIEKAPVEKIKSAPRKKKAE
jgi:hypothetical protein